MANSRAVKKISLVAGVILLCACFWAIWQIYSGIASRTERIAIQNEEIAVLTSERERLQRLLTDDPCVAKSELEKSDPGASGLANPSDDKRAATALQEVEDACVFIVSTDGAGHIFTGSGFFVAPGYVLTNRHVVEKGKGKILITGKTLGAPVIGAISALGRGAGNDYALLSAPDARNVKILEFAPQVKKTEKVGAWGFPDLVGKNDPAYARLLRGEDIHAVPELSYSEGVISAILDRQPGLLVHTAPISPGNSGGPLVNASGQVVGMNTLITLDEDSYRQASIAITAADIENFLREQGINPAQGR